LQIVDPAFVAFDRHLDPAVRQCAFGALPAKG
jgi:hypothetical protein